MNFIGFLSNGFAMVSTTSPWALLLMKATLLLAVAWLIFFALARTNPRWRTLLWRGVIVGLAMLAVGASGLLSLNIRVAAPAPSATMQSPSRQLIAAGNNSAVLPYATLPPKAEHASVEMGMAVPQTAVEVRPATVSMPWLSWSVILLGIWGLGVMVLLIRITLSYRTLARLPRASQAVPEEILTEARQIAAALGCHCAVEVRSSRHYPVPFLYGLRRPVLVLPERMCQPEYRPQLPGIIAHELAHVRSRDFGWNISLQAISILLWFHPLVWRIGSAHRAACDAVCDAISASYLGDVQAYCRTLARVALEGAASFPAAGLAMARSCDVRRRIAALKKKVFAAAPSRRTVVVAALFGLFASALLSCTRLSQEKRSANTASSQSLSQPGIIMTYVGPRFPVDGALATTQSSINPTLVALDGVGGFYFSSSGQHRIYHVAANGRIRLVAGTGIAGYGGDGGPAASAQLNHPAGLALDSAGNLYIADSVNHRIRKVTAAGVIATVAQADIPYGVAVDSAGNLYIADVGGDRIRKVTPDGVMTTVAGGRIWREGSVGDGGKAISAQLRSPRGVAVDSADNLYIADTRNHRIRKVTPSGVITTVAGNGKLCEICKTGLSYYGEKAT
jgi:beta-lactamase regulating signal transducer with metallopeptidase domain